MVSIKTYNTIICDNRAIVRNSYEAPKNVDFKLIQKEIRVIKANLKKGSLEFQLVDSLEKSSKSHDWKALSAVVSEFACQFTSATLANLMGSYLSRLFIS